MQLEQELKEKTADIEKLLERMLPGRSGASEDDFFSDAIQPDGWRQADSSITDR